MSIEVKHITKNFGNVAALQDVSLKIETGELIALLGPSGSGKSTLLRIIAGLETYSDRGGQDKPPCILFDNEPVDHRDIRQRGVGFVFQHYSLFKHMTVAENIAFGLNVKPRSVRLPKGEIQRKVRNLLSLIQLETLAERYPHQLSGGQRQRVALARALAVEPKVLLLDEPFGALDAKVRAELRKWLRRLHDEIHVTSLFVTHDQEEALDVADRVVVMNGGKIEQVGTPDEVFHSPKTRFVMEFIGGANRIVQYDHLTGGINGSIYVRAHDLQLVSPAIGGLPATIRRVHTAGPLVQIEASLHSPDIDGSEQVRIEIPYDKYNPTEFVCGNEINLLVRKGRSF